MVEDLYMPENPTVAQLRDLAVRLRKTADEVDAHADADEAALATVEATRRRSGFRKETARLPLRGS